MRQIEELFESVGELIPEDLQALIDAIAVNSADIATNATNIATNAADILTKQDIINSITDGQFVFVSKKEDFPTPIAGIITLAEDTIYYVTADIDLTGDRLVANGMLAIVSASPEIGRITSTGLSASNPVLTSLYTVALNNIGFHDLDYAISLDGSASADFVLDWHGVNFIDCVKIGEIVSYNNAIFNLMGIIDSANLSFDGTFGTISFSNTLFSGIAAQTTLTIESTCVITRRFRTLYSAFVAFGGATALDVSTSATIPDEGYILDTCNFSGGATFIAGVQHDDDKSLFSNNKGIDNSTQQANYYMIGNLTPTPIVSGTPTKVLGTTTEDTITERFTHTNNRATYDGAITRKFKVDATAALTSNNNNVLLMYVAKNGAVVAQSKSTATANAGGRAEGVYSMALVSLATTDYIEIFVDNQTGSNAITDVDLNVTVT